MSTSPLRVLFVDDDEVLRPRLARAFRDRGAETFEAASGEAALALAADVAPTHAVVDLRMPGMGGVEVVRRLIALDANIAVVLLTGYGSIATAVEAMRLGARNYLTKPADADEILRAFEASGVGTGAMSSVAAAELDAEAVPSLARAEWEHISRVLTECNGNISQAARLLGMHRRSLQRKLQKYPVKR